MTLLSQYFERVHFSGTAKADLATLKTLHRLHPASIPFENIDVLLNAGIDIQLPSIIDKLISKRRGGYCFEQNNLMMAVLKEIGFEVEALLARVLWRQEPNTAVNPRTHMVLRVAIDNESWLVDVGFGGIVLTAPLKLTPNIKQPTPHEVFRLRPQGDASILEVQLGDKWHPVYELEMQPQHPIDFEMSNWYTSTYPSSKFRHTLMMARATEDTRYTLLNNDFTIRKLGQEPIKTHLNTDELVDTLEQHFLLTAQPEWLDVFKRISIE